MYVLQPTLSLQSTTFTVQPYIRTTTLDLIVLVDTQNYCCSSRKI